MTWLPGGPTISIRYVVRLLELAERDGADVGALLAGAGMAPVSEDQPDVRVPTEQYYRLWSVTMAALRDPSFPMRLADAMDTASFDALGYAVITSATYGAALKRIQRYLPFVTDGARWAIDLEGETAILRFTQEGERAPAHRHVDEFSLAHLLVVGRKLTRAPWDVQQVRFRHPEPSQAQLQALESFFRAPLAFGCDTTELRLPRFVLDLPFPDANPNMAAFFDRYIESILQRTHPEHGFVTSVRKLLAESLVRHADSLENVASQLGMSPRTLRRRLREHDVAFSELREEVRQELAEQYLRDRRLSIGEVAFALGYSEPATFHRAFRRWKGMTPAAYRKTHRPVSPRR